MSSSNSGSTFHIPFPSNFLSLNTRPRKASNPAVPVQAVASPPAEASPHTFLSNRPNGRSYSMSSDSSEGTGLTLSRPSSPDAKAVTSPSTEQKPSFLALNTKFVAPPTTAREIKAEKSLGGFLSNRH